MASAFTPMPQGPSGPPTANEQLAQPLVPELEMPLGAGAMQSPDAIFAAFVQQIAQITKNLESLAQAHPEAAEEFNTALEAIKNSAAKVAASVSAPAGPEQPPVL